MKTTPIIYTNPSAAPTISEAALVGLGFSLDEIATGRASGELETRGLWQIPVKYRALLVSAEFDYEQVTTVKKLSLWRMGTLHHLKECGYQLEGRVKLNGFSYRGFASSQLFTLPSGKLFNCGVIHVVIS